MFFQIYNLLLSIVKCSYRQEEEKKKKSRVSPGASRVGARLAG